MHCCDNIWNLAQRLVKTNEPPDREDVEPMGQSKK